MANSGPWADFEVHRNSIRHNTVAKLQTIISGWTDQCRVSIPKSGKKQDLIDRMTRMMNDWKENHQVEKWLRAKAVLEQVRETGQYNHYTMPDLSGVYHPHQTYGGSSSQKINGNSVPYPAPVGAGPSHLRYDPYAAPRKPAPSTASMSSSSTVKPSIRFKSSPFYRMDQQVSNVIECPESTSAMDRRSQSLTFTLTSEQLGKLQLPNTKHQLRLFCTSSIWHVHHHTGFRTEPPCPIEFPATCEVRVNNVQLTANLKGLKKKPGTAPPPDLGRSVKLTTQTANRLDMVYVNSQQPVQHKKFYMVVYLVETTSVEQLVEKMGKGKYKSEADIRTKMVQTAAYDDDIVAGPQRMSLKCPLSYLRVNTPCRSIQCPHAQCFDATSWFQMMEQTTTWLCPVCDKILNPEELIIDGYFDQILRDTPESVEDVIVEADGEWHTSDDKYASAGWRASHPLSNGVKPSKSPSPHKDSDNPSLSPVSLSKANPNYSMQEVITLSDSEDDDEGRVKRELSPTSGYTTPLNPSYGGSSQGRSERHPPLPKISSAKEVIDLTLDSDDDEASPPPILSRNLKRKEREPNPPTEIPDAWKKARYSAPCEASSGATSNTAVIQSPTYGGYNSGVGGTNGSGVNGPSHGYRGSGVSGSPSWGSVRILPSAQTQPSYQAPHLHPTPSSSGMSARDPQNLNGYHGYAPDIPRPMINGLPATSPIPPYYNNQYEHR